MVNGHREIVSQLLAYGGDVASYDAVYSFLFSISHKYQKGASAIHYASLFGHRDILITLLEAGANIHDKNQVQCLIDIRISEQGWSYSTSYCLWNEFNSNGYLLIKTRGQSIESGQ